MNITIMCYHILHFYETKPVTDLVKGRPGHEHGAGNEGVLAPAGVRLHVARQRQQTAQRSDAHPKTGEVARSVISDLCSYNNGLRMN